MIPRRRTRKKTIRPPDPCFGSMDRPPDWYIAYTSEIGSRPHRTEGGRGMKRSALVWIALLVGAATYALTSTAMAVKESPEKSFAKADAPVKEDKCFECHDEIRALKTGSKHAKINCASCHSGTAEHLADS